MVTPLLLRRLALDAAVPLTSRSRPALKVGGHVPGHSSGLCRYRARRPQCDAHRGEIARKTPASPDPRRSVSSRNASASMRRCIAQLEAPRPLQPSLSAQSLNRRRAYLADAIRKVRPVARQREIFTPDVAQPFRGLIAQALTGRDPETMLLDLFEDHSAPPVFHLRVYDSYPDWATHEMPMILLHWLPPLPADLEYRLVDHDLVLWDAHADLILDVLADAIPRPSS